jgi:uncharacterized protein (TIGR02996 family)
MDPLAQHEAFLRAIFDAPGDDTPRLLYADFLDENGDPARAELIRVQCELARIPDGSDPFRQAQLGERVGRLVAAFGRSSGHDAGSLRHSRGFDECSSALVRPDDLIHPDELRRRIVSEFPEWFGAPRVAVYPGLTLREHHIEPLFTLPAFARVTEWDFGGYVEEVAAGPQTADAGTYALVDLDHHAAITVEGVAALARTRAARRIVSLDLTNNGLDNDAARELVQSPYLVNLKHLHLFEGNRPSGRVWQQLLERFGDHVVG